jgi:glycosyltransferase involved in cell wall biosynthesis
MSATVAYVDHAEQVGGAEKSLVELIAHLDRARFDPAILHVPDAQWLRYAENLRVRLRPALPRSTLYATRRDELSGGPGEALWRLGEALRPMRALYREFGALRPALVHTNSTKMHLLAGVAARARRRPVVWHMRDRLTEPGALAWLRRAVRMVRPHVIAISEAVAAQFEGMPCPVRVIPNGIPLERFEPGPPPPGLRAALGLPDGAPVVCVVARLTPWKGHQVLLRAWPAVCARVPEARLLVVGEVAFWQESYGDELRALAEELGVADSVHWLGFRADVADLLRLSDLLVLPSTDEPFGRVLIEAMAVGLPVVATASGGAPEIVVDGATGLLAPPSDAGALADAIAELLSDPPRARAMGAAGRVRALERFDVRRVARQVQNLYDALLA